MLDPQAKCRPATLAQYQTTSNEYGSCTAIGMGNPHAAIELADRLGRDSASSSGDVSARFLLLESGLMPCHAGRWATCACTAWPAWLGTPEIAANILTSSPTPLESG